MTTARCPCSARARDAVLERLRYRRTGSWIETVDGRAQAPAQPLA
ncbi:hypothetical protein ACIOGZ_28345 [Kitasatospora sp. NPDC088160]